MGTLQHSCEKVCEPSELRLGVVHGVGRGIAVFDGSPRRATGRGGLGVLFSDFYYWKFPLHSCSVAARSVFRTAGVSAGRAVQA